MHRAPRHVESYVQPASEKCPVPGSFDDYHPLYQVVCACGGRLFHVLADEMPRVVADCGACANRVTVYDVRLYPAATGGPGGDELHDVSGGDVAVEVFVMYEYGDPDIPDDFDPDDISWCQVFTYDARTGSVELVLDDETA